MPARPTRRDSSLAATALAAALLLSACGGSDNADAASSPTPSPSASPCWAAGSGSAGELPGVEGDFGSTPVLSKPSGEAPTEVVSKDLVTGAGATAAASSTVSVNYHGVKWSDGCVFDSSFARGQAVDFPLDNLIPCWQEGIPGMAVGGRRLLVCPPESAYGPADSGHPLGGETLTFVIDLVNVS